MTIANDIISGRMPDFDAYLRTGESLEDIDEYGFTPLIESAITGQLKIAEELLRRRVAIDAKDVCGRTALHWSIDEQHIELMQLLLNHGADPNAYNSSGLSTLVYPLLRGQDKIKQILYHHGAKLDFAQDFIMAKLIGHRFELKGDVDIVNAKGEFIELDYEGFILEFSVNLVRDALRRFVSSYSTRHLRQYFPPLMAIMDALNDASELLKFQQIRHLSEQHLKRITEIIKQPLVILPAASRGHALCFVKYHQWWVKIDRGENSHKEGSVNLYKITRPDAFNRSFIQDFLYKRQNRRYFHQVINQQLGLMPMAQMTMSSQITGNCSWANVQALIPAAFAIQNLQRPEDFNSPTALAIYDEWVEWDKDRALDECIQRFYIADPKRKASLASMLGGILFQACDSSKFHHVQRAEKILNILTLPEYRYILDTYLDFYCVRQFTRRGNNLLKLLDDCGVPSNIHVNPIATGL